MGINFRDPKDIIEQAELKSRPVPNYLWLRVGEIYNEDGERVPVVNGDAIFCSSTGTMWTLENDEFYDKLERCTHDDFYKCTTGCSVRCVEDK